MNGKADENGGSEERVEDLRAELTRLRQELAIRTELARVVGSYTTPRELLPNVLQVLCDGFGANGGAIYFMGHDSNEIELKATHGLEDAYAVKYQKIHLGSHVTGVVAETGEGMIIKDASEDRRSTKGVVQMLKYRSAVVVPVTSKGEVVGIIALINEKPDFFTQKDLNLLEFMGSHISLAIVNSFLNEEIAQERERTFNILEQVEEGIFQAEVPESLEMIPDVEAMTVRFYQDAIFTQLNPSFQRQCGGDIIDGSPMHRGFEDIQLFRMLKEVFSSGSVKGVERRWSGEEEKLFEVSMASIGKGDRIKGVMGTRRDMTSRVQMEERLKESKAQTELYMNVLSHDIANVNTAIMGFMSILQDRMGPDHELIRYVDQSLDAIERSTQMIRKVKGLSKAQKGKGELSMADLVERLMKNFNSVKREFPHKTAKMEMDPQEGPFFIRCDEMIDELLSNLLRNSVSSVDMPTAQIDVHMKEWEFGGTSGYLLSISDNGPGVPEDLRERVMSSSGKTTGDSIPGSGLGLILVKSIAERYGGRIWFENEARKGSRETTRTMVFLPSFDRNNGSESS